MLKISLLLLITLFGYDPTSGLDIPILSDIQDVIGLAHDISDIISGNVPLLSLFTGSKPDPVQQKLDGLSKQIEALTTLFNVKIDNAVSQILTNVPRETDFRARMSQLGQYISRIDFLFDNHRRMLKANSGYNKYSIEQFVDSATSLHEGDIPETLNQMHRLFVGRRNDDTQENLLQVAIPIFKDMKPVALCERPKSPQQRLYDIYRTVVFTEIKGFLMTSYAYGLLGIYHNTTFVREVKTSEERLISRVNEYLTATKAALKDIPRQIYVCDPPKHKPRVTYTEMRRFTQLTVLHEWMLRDSETCYGGCDTIDTLKIYRNFSYPESDSNFKWAPISPCQGRINECRDLDEVEFCEMEGFFKERLVYADSKKIGTYGDKKSCFFGKKTKLDSFMYNFRWCEPCMCTCTEGRNKDSRADRAFNLRPQTTNLEKNMVLTGIRFAKDGYDILHLQIEQGKLIKDGRIEENSTEWLPLEEIKFKSDVSDDGGFVLISDGKEIPLKEETDYAYLNYKRRSIHFDYIYPRYPDYVATGAKLKISIDSTSGFTLAMRLTRFNFTTGEFITETDDRPWPGDRDTGSGNIPSVWVADDYVYHGKKFYGRSKLDVKGRLDPSKFYGNVPDSEDHSQVELTTSNGEDDAGQSTIPYFDMQTVAPTPRVALDGLGFYHRGNSDSGGFIAISVATHDLSLYLNPTIKSDSLRPGELEEIQDEKSGTELN